MRLVLLLAGLAFLAIALFMAIPVAVNLPDSWPGAALMFVLVSIAIVMFRRAARKGRDSES
jgi:membrane protein implicated in regulation of membrane protease activity